MSIFGRQKKSRGLLPVNIESMMSMVGRFEFDPEGSNVDVAEFSEIYPLLLPLAQADSREFVATLAQATLPAGGWAVYGGARTVANLLGWEFDHSDYRAMLSAALHHVRDSGVSREKLNSYEWRFWLDNEGGAETWPT